MSPGLASATAIVGVGQTEFSKAAGRSETQLASEAIVAALADAGLTTADVDGLVSYTIDPVEETELVRAVGIPEIGFSSRVPYGGGGSQGVAAARRGRGRVGRRRRGRRLPGGESPSGEPDSVGPRWAGDRRRHTRVRRRCNGALRSGS